METKNKSKLKEIANMDVKDITKLLKKDSSKSNDSNSFYKLSEGGKKKRKKEKSKAVLSIDLGANSIKAVEGKVDKNKIILNKVINVKTPEGSVADGKILNDKAVEKALKSLIKRNKIKAKDIIFTTNSSSIINRDISIPLVEAEEMETVIRYEIQQYLPINLDDYIIQYIILDEIVDDIGAKLKINVTAFPERMAYDYYKLIESLQLNPYALDVDYNSINKLANYAEYTSSSGEVIGGTVAFIDMGATSINVAIFKNGKLDFTRMIKSGGDEIYHSLNHRLNMSIKTTGSLKMDEIDLFSDTDYDILNVVVKDVIDEILEELERIIKFYTNKANRNIDEIYIYGGLSNLNNIDLYMKDKLSLDIKKIEEIKNIIIKDNKLKNKSISEYLNAIGVMIRL